MQWSTRTGPPSQLLWSLNTSYDTLSTGPLYLRSCRHAFHGLLTRRFLLRCKNLFSSKATWTIPPGVLQALNIVYHFRLTGTRINLNLSPSKCWLFRGSRVSRTATAEPQTDRPAVPASQTSYDPVSNHPYAKRLEVF